MSRNYLQSHQFRLDDQKYAERMDVQRSTHIKPLRGLNDPCRTLEQAQWDIAEEEAKWRKS